MHDQLPSASSSAIAANQVMMTLPNFTMMTEHELKIWCTENRFNLLHSTHHEDNHSEPDLRQRPEQLHVWLSGLVFVTVISLCAVFGILVMRCLNKNIFNRFITFFVSVGVGSLSGSAVFHLLPQAFGLVIHSHGNGSNDYNYLWKSFATLVGIYIFFFSDKAIKIVLETKKRSLKETPLNANEIENNEGEQLKNNGQLPNLADVHLLDDKEKSPVVCIVTDEHHIHNGNGAIDADRSISQQTHALCVHDHEYKHGDSVIATVAWMIIFGDGLHNFIDGVTIGAAFSESLLSGISVSVAVLCEEFPHELGDVAILISAGMTIKQALIYNVLSALTCYIGFVIGVFVGNINETFATYTFGFAGGMFLYISLGCMMPEMKNAMEKALNVSLCKGLEVLSLQASGVITGLFCMFVMARYGENIEFS